MGYQCSASANLFCCASADLGSSSVISQSRLDPPKSVTVHRGRNCCTGIQITGTWASFLLLPHLFEGVRKQDMVKICRHNFPEVVKLPTS